MRLLIERLKSRCLAEVFSAKDFDKGLRNQIRKLEKSRNTYVVVDVEVEFENGSPGKQTVSGSIIGVSNWLSDMAGKDIYKKIKPVVKEFSSDRNWARKQATEV